MITQHGIIFKIKKTGGRRNNTCCHTYEDIERTVTFIQDYALTHGLLLLGRNSGVNKDGVILMSSCKTKVRGYTTNIKKKTPNYRRNGYTHYCRHCSEKRTYIFNS